MGMNENRFWFMPIGMFGFVRLSCVAGWGGEAGAGGHD